MPSFYVSAPGKVILFGEHSAVYGKPAIAAALSLRAYLLVQPCEDPNEIVLEFPDIQLTHRWNLAEIRELFGEDENGTNGTNGKSAGGQVPWPSAELDPRILEKAERLLKDTKLELHYTACRCFLYLYLSLCSAHVTGHRFCIRLTLPIGAGLGSSALTAVCLAAGLAVLGGHVSTPSLKISEFGSAADPQAAEFIDAWSFMGEKCFHGNPSGIDNAVATRGGAVKYQRAADPAMPLSRDAIQSFAALKLLLINTKVPRSTAKLVGGVGTLRETHPAVIDPILDAMSHVASDAYDLLTLAETAANGKGTVNGSAQNGTKALQIDSQALRELVRINHGLLVALGVSHPSLEEVRIITERHDIGATKLTGAGGGGCAITVLHEDVTDSQLSAVKSDLAAQGFETFEAMLGGKGVGLMRAEDCGDLSVFDSVQFTQVESRDEIERWIGASERAEWRFW